MSTTPIANEAVEQIQGQMRKRGCLFYIGRGLKWFGIFLILLIVLGVVYQTVTTETEKGAYTPRGQLYTVNGHQMHMICMGEGSPSVILEAGGSADSLWWYWVQNQVAEQTQVCAYDRPGHGWSEPTTEPRDALTLASELHTLLEQADVPAPHVIAGHSYGAVWARIYAAQYPEEVVGLVLVDSTFLSPDKFANQGEFDGWKSGINVLKALEWATYRVGLVRLSSSGDFQRSGYPSAIVPELAALRSPNRIFDADYAEQIATRMTLTEAANAAKHLGDLPMAVLWAGLSPTVQDYFTSFRNEIATYSSNTATRVIEGADHGSILGNEQYAQQVSDAILDVIASAQTGEPLAQ